MEITNEEVRQIRRLSRSSSITNLSEAILRSLDERTLSRLVGGYLYMKSQKRPDRDFAMFLATKELWSTLVIGLSVMGAVIPAMIFDEEFRTLTMKVGLIKGMEIGSKSLENRVSSSERNKAKVKAVRS